MGLISVYQQYGSYFRSVDQRIITAKASVRAELWRGKELMQGTHHPERERKRACAQRACADPAQRPLFSVRAAGATPATPEPTVTVT